jgi:hypothetical protein
MVFSALAEKAPDPVPALFRQRGEQYAEIA